MIGLLRLITAITVMFSLFITNNDFFQTIQKVIPDVEMGDERSEKQMINDMFFAAAIVRRDMSLERYMQTIDRYGAAYKTMNREENEVHLFFGGDYYLTVSSDPIEHAWIIIGKELPLMISMDLSKNQEEYYNKHMQVIDPQAQPDLQNILELTENYVHLFTNDSQTLKNKLIRCLLEASTVYPGMPYEMCSSIINSGIFQSEIITDDETGIWLMHELDESVHEPFMVSISYYFTDKKLSCIDVSLFSNYSFVSEGDSYKIAKGSGISPTFMIDFESTWLIPYIE